MDVVARIVNVITRTANVFVFVGIAAVLGIMGVALTNIIMRALFSRALVGMIEISEMCMAVLFTALACAKLSGKLTYVDFLVEKLPFKVARVVDVGVLCVCIYYCISVGIQVIIAGQDAIFFGSKYPFIDLPKGPFMIIMGASFCLTAVVTVILIMRVLKEKEKKEIDVMDDPELDILSEEDRKV